MTSSPHYPAVLLLPYCTATLTVSIFSYTPPPPGAGPGIVLSFLFAGLTIFLGALCLTEFAARVPHTGSTYLYTYVTLGELLAFLIGWSMVSPYPTRGPFFYLKKLEILTFKNN